MKSAPLSIVGRVSAILAGLLIPGLLRAERVIIRTSKPYSDLVAEVHKAGGRVHREFKYVDAIAAEIPGPLMDRLRSRLPEGAMTKDKAFDLPRVARGRDGRPLLAHASVASAKPRTAVAAATAGSVTVPANYLINDRQMNLSSAFSAGFLGQGIKVAVIDSGHRPGFSAVDADGTVIGGEDLVGDGLGWSNFDNNGHGTFVTCMISANVVLTFDPESPLLAAVRHHSPESVTGIDALEIPLLGAAPAASVYSVRVFPPEGGAPESRVIAAMERVIELRENFDKGMPETRNPDGSYNALNIQVCNMSLSGSTLHAGRDLEDQLTRTMLERDIVLVSGSGNAGPSGSTVGSPGTGPGCLTTGASSSPAHARIQADVFFGAGSGEALRPFNHPMTAYFSARGPTVDGRPDPDVVANGDACLGQGFGLEAGTIDIASGTSFSSPSVAGVAAVLRQMAPKATAREIRSAIILSADSHYLKDGSTFLDQGAGFVDAAAAAGLLRKRRVPVLPALPGIGTPSVKINVLVGGAVMTRCGNVTQTIQRLRPGQRHEVYYEVPANTASVVVNISDFEAGKVQNEVFGDDLLLTVHSAKTSAINGVVDGDYPVFEYTKGGTYVVERPDEGLMRITVSGDNINAGQVGATVNIFSTRLSEPGRSSAGRLFEGETAVFPFNVPAGAAALDIKLAWDGSWARYPTNDLDLILVDAEGNFHFDGATLACPERVSFGAPVAGTWFAIVEGLAVNSAGGDRYQLRVSADGKVLR